MKSSFKTIWKFPGNQDSRWRSSKLSWWIWSKYSWRLKDKSRGMKLNPDIMVTTKEIFFFWHQKKFLPLAIRTCKPSFGTFSHGKAEVQLKEMEDSGCSKGKGNPASSKSSFQTDAIRRGGIIMTRVTIRGKAFCVQVLIFCLVLQDCGRYDICLVWCTDTTL